MSKSSDASDLKTLAENIRRQTENWPSSMRSPKPGTDLMWERVATGPGPGKNSSAKDKD